MLHTIAYSVPASSYDDFCGVFDFPEQEVADLVSRLNKGYRKYNSLPEDSEDINYNPFYYYSHKPGEESKLENSDFPLELNVLDPFYVESYLYGTN